MPTDLAYLWTCSLAIYSFSLLSFVCDSSSCLVRVTTLYLYNLQSSFMYTSTPLSTEEMAQDQAQWMPETVDNTEPCMY